MLKNLAEPILVTYLTTRELAERIKYDERTIRERLKDSVLLEGRHYIRTLWGAKDPLYLGDDRGGHG